MMGRRPEPVPGVEPGRWRVVRVRGVGSSTMDWYVDRENCHGAAFFRTWREAQDYADRMARTREVVLPRPTRTFDGRPEFDFSEESGLDYNTPRTAVYDGALDLEYCCDTTVLIPREHWRPLAAALWALAEMEGVE